MISLDDRLVAEDVYRFGTTRIGWYVVADDEALTVVDAGLPGHWRQLVDGVTDLGYELTAVEAVLLTHGDADHVGIAEWLRRAVDAPVYLHPADADLACGGPPGLPPTALLRSLWRPATLAYVAEVIRSGVRRVPPLRTFEPIADGDVLDVPGRPRVVHLPGHTAGSCAFHFADHGVLCCGDAAFTLDVRTGEQTAPRVLPPIHYDAAQARRSVQTLAEFGDAVLLPGHGDPWEGDVSAAGRTDTDAETIPGPTTPRGST
ncbi:MBL fold metallo-hydrolase [Halobaculum marinum]|uniref:MBL fold metallo-hydrolase n=1 Tax=Halobaculum marinum TaxID=3031996 RepID=A0ABD5X009_9EURY|nr:MBL fold metallo-hydrolase [Halobaculum sp. DT55]